MFNRLLAALAASHTGHYTPADPAYYQLLAIFSGALRRELRRLLPEGQVTYPGIGVFTQRLEGLGVTPTIEVPWVVEYAQGKGPQLERALERLSRTVRG